MKGTVPAERSMPLHNPSPSLTGTSLYCAIAVMLSSRDCNKASPTLPLVKHLKCSETSHHWCCSQLYSLPKALVSCRRRSLHPKLAGQYARSRWTSFLSISNKSNSILQERVGIPISTCREIEMICSLVQHSWQTILSTVLWKTPSSLSHYILSLNHS